MPYRMISTNVSQCIATCYYDNRAGTIVVMMSKLINFQSEFDFYPQGSYKCHI